MTSDLILNATEVQEDIFRKVLALAEATNDSVHFSYGDVRLKAAPTDTFASLEAQYAQELEADKNVACWLEKTGKAKITGKPVGWADSLEAIPESDRPFHL